jgi:hypothetical protein
MRVMDSIFDGVNRATLILSPDISRIFVIEMDIHLQNCTFDICIS